MNRDNSIRVSLYSTILFGLLAILLVISIIYAPDEAFKASAQGLSIWWRIIFPALLPFLVLSQILIASGFVHGIGTLLEPFTQKWLGLPGSSGWILPLGMITGFPAAADAVAALYKQRKVTALEAEKMAAMVHFSSPMLIIIVISTGFFKSPELGWFLLAVHWLSGLTAGITLHAFRPSNAPSYKADVKAAKRKRSLIHVVYKNIDEARQEDGRSFGKILGDSVGSSVQTLMTIGGYIIIFAVVIYALSSALPDKFPLYVISGLLEVHLGTYSLVEEGLPSSMKVALLSAFLGWGGLCALLQIQAILKPLGISGRLFIIQRILHGVYAYVITLLLWKPLSLLSPKGMLVLPALTPHDHSNPSGQQSIETAQILLPDLGQIAAVLQWQLWLLLGLTLFFIVTALLVRQLRNSPKA